MVAAGDLRLARAVSSQPTKRTWESHEAIYRSLFIQTRGVLKKCRRAVRVLRGGCVTPRATTRRVDRGIVPRHGLYPRSGPAEIELSRCAGIREERPPDPEWRIDTHIATLVERSTRLH